jgi:hypothetical protein
MENHSFSAFIGSSQAPYFNTLAQECGLATNYHNITHPSLPNYVAATSGLSYSALPHFLPDCSPSANCDTSAKSIFGQGETWKSYQESMPSSCDHGNSGNYAVRHNPAARSGMLFNHYSLLGTAEQLLGLARLGQAAGSTTMTKAFNL